jgi:FkbM family methyltransferase
MGGKTVTHSLTRIAVVTHARNEDLFLSIWSEHYGRLFGRNALHLLKDGDDWSSSAEAEIAHRKTVRFAGTRTERDSQMAMVLSEYCNSLLDSHDFVLRCDCDEILATDPASGDWNTVFEECRANGYIYSLGLDVTQHLDKESGIDLSRPILEQRRYARVTGEYCKPNLISAPVKWTSACHEIEGKPVRLSRALLLFHLASMDKATLEHRLEKRGDIAQRSYAGHEKKKLNQFNRLLQYEAHPFDTARQELNKKITTDDDGHEKYSPRFKKIFGRRWAAIELPDRFGDLIAPLRLGSPQVARPSQPSSRVRRLHEILNPKRRTVICDIGASAIEDVPYAELLEAGLCEVWGFEPSKDQYEVLRASGSDTEHYLPYALGDGKMAKLHLTQHPGFSSTLAPNTKTSEFLGRWKRNLKILSTEKIRTKRLDDLLELPNFDMIAIDVQGSELQILSSGVQKLSSVSVVMTEVAAIPIYINQPLLDDQMRMLREHGFTLHKFLQFRSVPIKSDLTEGLRLRENREQLTDGDAVFVKDLLTLHEAEAESLKHLALLADSVFGSPTLALKAVSILRDRGELESDDADSYASLI